MKQSLESHLLMKVTSFNKVISKGQRDVLVTFWNTADNRVTTCYVNSVVMGNVTASDVLENFEAASKGFKKNKFIQGFSDGFNDNLKILVLLAEKHKDDVYRTLKNADSLTIWNIKN